MPTFVLPPNSVNEEKRSANHRALLRFLNDLDTQQGAYISVSLTTPQAGVLKAGETVLVFPGQDRAITVSHATDHDRVVTLRQAEK